MYNSLLIVEGALTDTPTSVVLREKIVGIRLER